MKIGPKIYVVVALLIVTGLVAIGIAYQGMNEIRNTYDKAFTSRAPITRVIENFRSTLPDSKLQVWSVLVPDLTKEFLDQQLNDMSVLKKSFSDYEADWAKNAGAATPAEQQKFAVLKAATDKMWVAIDEYTVWMKYWSSTHDAAARQKALVSNDTGAVDSTTKDVETALADLVKVNTAENKKAVAEAASEQRSAMTNLFLAVGITVVVGLALSVLIAGSITGPLKKAVAFADAVAAGDLEAKIPTHGTGEIGELTKAIEAMKESLVDRVNQMREVAATVELAAEGVSATAADVLSDAKASGNDALAAKGEKLASQANNLVSALKPLK